MIIHEMHQIIENIKYKNTVFYTHLSYDIIILQEHVINAVDLETTK